MPQIRCMKCMKTYDEQYDICLHCGYKRGTEPANPLYLPEGTVLEDKYLIGAAIGHGGFGITYIALDQLLDKRVAIKEYFPASLSTRTAGNPTIYPFTTQDADNNYRYGREKFIEEARTLAKFSGVDSIVSVLACFMQNNTAYIVMEYLEGEDLLEYVKRRGGKITWTETMTLMAPVMDALAALHAQGLIHRDISPDNIFVTKGGKTKLLDFGTARFAMGEKSKSLSVILKPGYAPPEQYSSRGKQGPWTDVYALAATIYRCVTGQTPIDAVDRQMGTGIELLSSLGVNIPRAAEDALMRALALEPEKRIQTVGDFRAAMHSKQRVSELGSGPYLERTEAESMAIPAMATARGILIDDEFDDNGLEYAIRDALPYDHIFDGDMEKIIELEASGEDIRSIEVLYYCKHIEKIVLNENKIKDLYPLESLIHLAHLDLSWNNIRDIYPLRGLRKLLFLDLGNNKVTDIEPITNLEELLSLCLSGNRIRNIEEISVLSKLQTLKLDQTGIRDIGFLARLKNLECIELFNNQVKDAGILALHKKLKLLDLSENPVTDMDAISDLTGLTELYLDNARIDNIDFVAKLSSLEILSLSNNHIYDLRPLAQLPHLRGLDLSGNDIDDCEPLSQLESLERLDLRFNRLKNIDPVSKLPGLKSLLVSGNGRNFIDYGEDWHYIDI